MNTEIITKSLAKASSRQHQSKSIDPKVHRPEVAIAACRSGCHKLGPQMGARPHDELRRQGRPAQITGATTNDFTFTAAGLLLSENVVNKIWNYASQNRLGYDALQRSYLIFVQPPFVARSHFGQFQTQRLSCEMPAIPNLR